MSYTQPGHGPLDYQPVTYPGSQLAFRGPAQGLNGPYVLCLGGSETYGKFVNAPYAAQLADQTGRAVVNLGAMNAGLDLLLHDRAIGRALAGAEAVVLQITGAQNMTNRFYRVHPRRNDRFLQAASLLETIYRDVDFTEFHFTRHMLSKLQLLSQDRFAIVVEELRQAWVARMRQLLAKITVPVHLLWIGQRHPSDPLPNGQLGSDPLFITEEMLNQIASEASSLTLVVSDGEDRAHPTRGKFFAAEEEAAARLLPGPELHRRAAQGLAAALGA